MIVRWITGTGLAAVLAMAAVCLAWGDAGAAVVCAGNAGIVAAVFGCNELLRRDARRGWR